MLYNLKKKKSFLVYYYLLGIEKSKSTSKKLRGGRKLYMKKPHEQGSQNRKAELYIENG